MHPEKTKLDEITLNVPENQAAAAVYSRLWAADVENCKGEREAVFQRTVLMSLFDRYRLVFGDTEGSESASLENTTKIKKKLAFSVETEWTCDPMPTRALLRDDEQWPFLPAPRPDICISFRTDRLIRPKSWALMPSELTRIICYEGDSPPFDRCAFGFFVVEAKRSRFSPDDEVAKYQALNSASQALHNMYEFFRQAGQEEVFFNRVRVFSATTSEKGLLLRIHRAERIVGGTVKSNTDVPNSDASDSDVPVSDAQNADTSDSDSSGSEVSDSESYEPIYAKPDYELEFRFEEYKTFYFGQSSRQDVIDVFAKIMIAYGERRLHGLLKKAAHRIHGQLQACQKQLKDPARIVKDFRHGQTPGRNRSGS